MLSGSPHFEGYNELQVEKYMNIGEMKLNLAEKNVVIHGAEVMLTNREFEILYLPAQSPGRIFSKEQIYDIVMSHIHHIREKIEDIMDSMQVPAVLLQSSNNPVNSRLSSF